MAKYIKQEMPDLRQTGEKKVYYRLKTTRNINANEFIQSLSEAHAGMSEADMQSMNAWWGTNGKWYLSISYADGTVTVDHMTELPDLSGLLG